MQKDNSPNLEPSATASTSSQRTSHVKTEGEKRFDFLTYNVIGYMANVLLSVGAVFWVERTHSGQKFMNGLVELAKKIPGVDGGWAKIIASKSFFLTGGFAVMPPMKMLEDKKAEWVKRENRKIYGDAVDTDPTLVNSQRELEEAPKQSWASLGSSRLLSLIPFYITTGILWDRMSPLSKMTNPELRALKPQQIEAMNPSKLSQIASKGFYIDRPIVAASRWIGKGIARLTGDTAALERMKKLQAQHPGTMRLPDLLKNKKPKNLHDPNHAALPYYFISEAITSAMVAWGVFAISRVMGPFFDKKHPTMPQATAAPQKTEDAAPAEAAPVAANAAAPSTRVNAGEMEHEAPTNAQLARA